MMYITKKPEELEAYRDSVLQAWIAWRGEVQEQVQQWVRAEDPSGNTKRDG
jgi:hypothetical protein